MTQTLVIAPQWIGDAVMTAPLLRRLHAQGKTLTVAALPWVAPVYRAMPAVAHVIELPFQHEALQWRTRWVLAQSLRHQFDVAYVLPNSLKSALLPWMAGIPQRIGYLGEHRYGLINQRLSNPSDKIAMVDFYSALANGKSSLAASDDSAIPSLQLDEVYVRAVGQEWGLHPQDFYALAPGAEYGPAKRWPVDKFIELVRMLDRPVVLLGADKDQAVCSAIAQSTSSQCLNLAGKTTLDQAFGLIAIAKAVVSNDSGLMHVAAALGVPQIAIFGSSSPLHTPPLNTRAVVLWLKNDVHYAPALDCAPCFDRVCALGHTRCLNDMRAQQVKYALDGITG